MIRHFFLEKTNTIVENSLQNIGINPVLQLGYGKKKMRGLIYFDMCQIQQLVEDKTFADLDKLTCTLKMTNCFSVDGLPYNKDLFNGLENNITRASSFDLVLFELPCAWDAGRGYDFVSDFWIRDRRAYSETPSNWYFPRNGYLWPYELDLIDYNDPNLNWADLRRNRFGAKGGIYSDETLKEEYEKYLNGEPSIVVGTQHFDFGNEGLAIDITKYVKKCLDGQPNFGLGIMFAPILEGQVLDVEQYVGFFTDKTNTFFHPYVEADYANEVKDDRESFTVGRDNNLCLYVKDNGMAVNLDELPTCSLDGKNLEVTQTTKGIYTAKIKASDNNLTPKAMYYDIWSNIKIDGEEQDDVELEVATNPKSRKLSIGSDSEMKKTVVPSLYGINDNEKLAQGEVREVTVDFRVQYSTDKRELIDGALYRLYVKDGEREIDVIPYRPVEKAYLNNFFVIYTQDLIPNDYFIDIKVNTGREEKYYKRTLKFSVVSNVTERYN